MFTLIPVRLLLFFTLLFDVNHVKYLLSERNNPNSRVRSNGVRYWGYPSRKGGTKAITCIGVHTTESAWGTLATSVAKWQAFTAPTPSSYHVLVDRLRNLVRTTEDKGVAFHIVGLNTRALGISFAMQAHRWGEDRDRDRAMVETAAVQCAEWSRKYAIPVRWITLAEAKRGVKGYIRHSTADPSRRRDPGNNFPDTLFFQLINQILSGRVDPLPPVRDDDKEAEVALTKRIQTDLKRLGFYSGNIDGDWGPLTEAAYVASPLGTSGSKEAIYEGKKLVSKVDGLNFYDSPRWDDPTGTFDAGYSFPTIKGKVSVGSGEQYEVYNSSGAGPFYVTASTKFVEVA